MGKTALLAGATGLVGEHVLQLLLEDARYDKVTAVVRRPLASHAKLRCVVADFDHLADHAAELQADDVFCCLGTTMKTAGSKEAFRKVDYDYVVNLAVLARRRGATKFALVSAVGASLKSPAFYPLVKAEAERDVAKLEYEAVHIFHPSFLLGERKEHRPGEKYGIALFRVVEPLLLGPTRRYRSIQAADVARAMLETVNGPATGVHRYEHDQIVEAAQ
jgi:uncharacterized protein YbjT (DUF2867 family)